MDWEGKIDSPRLLCAASGTAIEPGAAFWSALLLVDGLFVRRDYSLAAWNDQPHDSFLSWWCQRAPKPNEQPKAIDVAALLGMFHALKDASERPKQCFLFALLLFLVRARALRYRDSIRDQGQAYLLAEDKELKCIYKVRDPQMTPEEERLVQENLMTVLTVGGPATAPG